MRKLISIIVVLAVFVTVGCSTTGTVANAKDGEAADQQAQQGELELLNVTATPSMNSLTFRGTARNPYDEPIDGIRLVMQVRSDATVAAPELARAQKVMDTKLAPGEHTAFEIAVEIQPSSLAEPGLFLQAFAINRGGETLPAPPTWRE